MLIYYLTKYIKLYKKEKLKNTSLLCEISKLDEKLQKTIRTNEEEIENLTTRNEFAKNKYLEESKNNFCTQLSNLKLTEKLANKEKQRRKIAGLYGSLVKKYNKLCDEKKEMLNLINKLVMENQKLSKSKSSPTLNEVKKYIKIKY